MSLQFMHSEKESKEYEKQLILLARIKAAIAKKTDAGEPLSPTRKEGGLLETEDININDLMPDSISEAPEIEWTWESVFDNTGFLEQLELFKDGVLTFDMIRFNFVNGVKQMGTDLAANLSRGFGEAVKETLSGNKKFTHAIRDATKQTLIAQAADLAAQALYYGILGTALVIGGIIMGGLDGGKMVKKGGGMLATAAHLGAGAGILGGIGSAIKSSPTSGSVGVTGTGGNGNDGMGSNGGTFEDFMNAIQGEQVFRLAGNDLVTAINRTNTFQGSIGG